MKLPRVIVVLLATLSLIFGTTSVASAQVQTNGIDTRAITGTRVTGWSLDISKSRHRLVLLHRVNGTVVRVTTVPVSFAGCNADGCYHTPNGAFRVTRKEDVTYTSHTSHAWNGAPMPYAVFFYGGYAVHQDPLGASHGCIHVASLATMQQIHDDLPIGSVVVVHA